jgi:hypothetical protein
MKDSRPKEAIEPMTTSSLFAWVIVDHGMFLMALAICCVCAAGAVGAALRHEVLLSGVLFLIGCFWVTLLKAQARIVANDWLIWRLRRRVSRQSHPGPPCNPNDPQA